MMNKNMLMAAAMPQDAEETGPVKRGPVMGSELEPVDNGHMVTTRHAPHPSTPHRYPKPEVKAFEKEPGQKNHLVRAMNHLFHKHGGVGNLVLDTDKDGE